MLRTHVLAGSGATTVAGCDITALPSPPLRPALQVHRALADLPNVFAGSKPRKGRASQILDGATCRVLVVWQPPPPLLALGLGAQEDGPTKRPRPS